VESTSEAREKTCRPKRGKEEGELSGNNHKTSKNSRPKSRGGEKGSDHGQNTGRWRTVALIAQTGGKRDKRRNNGMTSISNAQKVALEAISLLWGGLERIALRGDQQKRI